MYMPSGASYYLYKKILDASNNILTPTIINNAVKIYGFKDVYYSGYVKNFKLFCKIDKKILYQSNLLSERSINYIYQK